MNDKISIIVPTINEVDNIFPTIAKINDIFEEIKIKYEIIFVDDMSTDGTLERLIKLEKENKIKLIIIKKKQGLGNSLLEGYKSASGDYILFLDCDLSINVDDIKRIISARSPRCIVIGSRYKSKSKLINVDRTRIILSYMINIIYSKIFIMKAIDLSHSFRIVPNIKLDISPRTLSHPGFFWELSYLHKNYYGLELKEIPITFYNRQSGITKNSLIRMVKSLLFSIFAIINYIIKN